MTDVMDNALISAGFSEEELTRAENRSFWYAGILIMSGLAVTFTYLAIAA